MSLVIVWPNAAAAAITVLRRQLPGRDEPYAPRTLVSPEIVNRVTDPTFGGDLSVWGSYGSTIAADTTKARFGPESLLVTCNENGQSLVGAQYTPGERIYQPGDTFTISASVATTVSTYEDVRIRVYDSTVPAVWDMTDVPITADGTWQRVSATFTAPSDRGLDRVYVLGHTSEADSSVGDELHLDGVMITGGDTVHDYGDGSLDGWSWDGTAHASTSTRAAVYETDVGVVAHVPDDRTITSSAPLVMARPDGSTVTATVDQRATIRLTTWHNTEFEAMQLAGLCQALLVAHTGAELRGAEYVSGPLPGVDPNNDQPLATCVVAGHMRPQSV